MTLTGSMLHLFFSPDIDDEKYGTHVKGSSQYSENIVTTMFVTIFSFVKSVAVRSTKTFRVFRVILLRSELMMGGNESTWSSLS